MQAAGSWKASEPGRFFHGEFGARHYTHIYAIAPKEGGCIKFGRATNVKSRFSGIQTGSPVKLEIIGSSLLPVPVEDAIHKHLDDYRSHGEWFLPTMETVAVAHMIRDKKHVDLLVRLKLYKILPDSVVEKINFDAAMSGENVDRADAGDFEKSSISSKQSHKAWRDSLKFHI